MRRKLLVTVGIFVFLLVLIFLLNLKPAPPPHVEMGFYGFTNTGPRLLALFGISNHPNIIVDLHSVSRLSTNASESNAAPLGTWAWGRWEPWGITAAINVETTNEPLRAVFEFQQRAAGPRRIRERIQELWGKMTGNEREFYTGSKFLVTNETRVSR
jgi:hypothetical protein